MIRSLSFPSRSPFLPAFNIECFEEKLPDTLTKRLAEIILIEEPNILNSTQAHKDDPDPTWLTSRLWQYNLFDFDYPEVRELKDWIRTQYVSFLEQKDLTPQTVYAQCWANIVRGHRTIFKHNHATAHSDIPPEYSYLSGNISVAAEGTRTCYQNPLISQHVIGMVNVPGTLLIFPSYVNHWVDENRSPNPRLSIAFDLIPESTYNLSKNKSNFRRL